jgi:hypothetical protein
MGEAWRQIMNEPFTSVFDPGLLGADEFFHRHKPLVRLLTVNLSADPTPGGVRLVRQNAQSRKSQLVIQGITIVGDIIRPDGKGRLGGTDRSTAWLFNAVKRPVQLACRLPVDLITSAGSDEIAAWIERSRRPEASALHWASIHDRLPDGDVIEKFLLQRLQERFCVGYEMPPYLIRILNRARIPWLDVRLHPVRFLDDLLFAVRAGEAETQAALLPISVAESEVIVTAGLREAMCRLISDAAVPPDTLIVAGQRPMDSSQIIEGRFFNALPRAAEIAAICARYQAVVLKPHPLPDETHSLLLVAAGQPNVRGVIADNLYRMLALPQVSAVLTVNSSIAYEAGYFGKIVHALAPLPIRLAWRGDAVDPAVYVSLNDQVLTADFWRAMLAPHVPVTSPDGVRLAPKPNRLRIALDSFWNYQQIDTDRIPRDA